MAKIGQAEVIKLYSVFFGRTPDAGGLDYWTAQAQGGVSITAIANAFMNSKEGKDIYEFVGEGEAKTKRTEKELKEILTAKVSEVMADSPKLDAQVKFVQALIEKNKKLLGSFRANEKLLALNETSDIDAAVDSVVNPVDFDVASLYVAFFNRLPDAEGFAFYKAKIEGEGWSLERVMLDFLASAEFHTNYKSTDEFIAALKNNLGTPFNEADLKAAIEAKETGYLVGFLDGKAEYGTLHSDFNAHVDLAVDILNSKKADKQASELFKELRDGTKTVDDLRETLDVPVVVPGEFKDDVKYGEKPFTLTKDADTLPNNDFKNDGNDKIEGTASSLEAENTLNAKDKIDGGAGKDKLVATLKADFAGFSEGGYLKGVEKVELTTEGVGSATFNATGVEKGTEFILKKDASLAGLSEIAKVALVGTRTADATIGFADAVVKGEKDALTLSTYNSNAKVIAEGIEELNLNVSGTNTIDNKTTTVTKVVAAGKSDEDTLTFTSTVKDKLKTFDASKMEGTVDADLKGVTSLESVVLGNASDTLTLDAKSTPSLKIAGGKGRDTLVVNKSAADATEVTYDMDSVEYLSLESIAADLTMNAAKSKGLELIVADDLANNATLKGLGAKNLTVQLKGAAADKTLALDHTGSTLVLVGGEGATGATNVLDVNLTKSNKLNLTVDKQMTYTGQITAAKAKSVGVSLKGVANPAAEIIAAEATKVEIREVEKASTLKLTTAAAELLNISAAKDLDLAGSTLGKVRNLTVKTEGLLTLADLADLGSATIDGQGKGAVSLGDLGADDMNHNIAITAKNLKNNASNDSKALKFGAITTAKDLALDLSGVKEAVEFKDAAATLSVGNKLTLVAGEAGVDLSSGNRTIAATGKSFTADITGSENNADALKIVADATVASITLAGDLGKGAGDTVEVGINRVADAEKANETTLNIANLKGVDGSVVVNLAKTDAATYNLNLTGSDKADDVLVKAAGTAAQTINLKGDLAGGADKVVVEIGGTGAVVTTIDAIALKAEGVAIKATTKANLVLNGSAGDDTYTILAPADVVLGAASTIGAAGKDTVKVVATVAATTVDATNATKAFTIEMAKGETSAATATISTNKDVANTIKLSNDLGETVTINAANSAVDRIYNFAGDADKLGLSGITVGGTGGNFKKDAVSAFTGANSWGKVNVITGNLSDLKVATVQGAFTSDAALTAADKFYVIATDGTNTAVYRVEDGATTDTIGGATFTQVATLVGFSNVSTLVEATNFAIS